MSLTTDIATIVNNRFPNATYALNSWFKANLKSYNIEEMTIDNPLIILNNELSKGKEIQPNVNILAETKVVMWFLVKGGDGVYTTDKAMNTDIELLEVMADQIYNNIFQLPVIRLKNNESFRYTVTPKFKIWNSVLVGVEAEARVKENQIRNFCTNKLEE